jgi:hypothetical protein
MITKQNESFDLEWTMPATIAISSNKIQVSNNEHGSYIKP